MSFRDDVTYGYPNARIKSMRSRLIGADETSRLLSAGSFTELVSMLERTDLAGELTSLSIAHSGPDLVDRALGMNLARAYSKVIRVAPPETLPVVNAFTGRWDVYNVKTILLGKHLGYSQKAIEERLVPAGRLDKSVLLKANAQESVDDAVFHLGGTEYGEALIKVYKAYKKSGDISVLTSELERHHYRMLGKAIGGGGDWARIRSLIGFEIDAKNIITLMRYVSAGREAFSLGESLIDGGRLSAERLMKMKEYDIPRIVSAVKPRVDLTEPLKAYEEDASIVHFETALERMLYVKGVRAFTLSTLSVGSIVGFLYMKEAEAGNVRRIVRGMEFGVPRERVAETLVV